MSMKLYYFSATGNSLAACKELQRGSEACSVESIVNISGEAAVHPDSDTVGFVFPVFYSGLPNIVNSFISKLDLSGVDYIFAVATKSQYGKDTLNRRRYRNPNISVEELLAR